MAVGKEKRQTVQVFFFEIVRRNSRILSKLARKRTHYMALYADKCSPWTFHWRSPSNSRTKVTLITDLRHLKYRKCHLIVDWSIKLNKTQRKVQKNLEIFKILRFPPKIIKYGGFLLMVVTSLPEFYIRLTWPNLVNDITPTTALLYVSLWKRRGFSEVNNSWLSMFL